MGWSSGGYRRGEKDTLPKRAKKKRTVAEATGAWKVSLYFCQPKELRKLYDMESDGVPIAILTLTSTRRADLFHHRMSAAR